MVVAALVVFFYAFFYRGVVRRWGRVFGGVADRLGAGSGRPPHETESLGRLLAAATAQVGFAALLTAVAGIPPSELVALSSVDLLLLGVLLGVAESGASTTIGGGIASVAASAGPRGRDWVARQTRGLRSGWMGQFDRSARAGASWVALPTMAAYVIVEEVVFRGIVLDAFRPYGAAAAVGVSAALFAAVQVFNMPSAGAALFPFVGGAVVGLMHGVVMWHVPQIAPLAVAHVVFFYVSMSRARAATARPPLARGVA